MANVVVTGAAGQLGQCLRQKAGKQSRHQYIFLDEEQLNITQEDNIRAILNQYQARWLINCAGYTAVDRAESEPDKAHQINAVGPGILARQCQEMACHLIHISTDFVFDGKSPVAYTEKDAPHPLSAYARSKAAGEEAVLKNQPTATIIRTAWLYSECGNNFLKTILRLASKKTEMGIVADQIGTPTYAGHLANLLVNHLETLGDAQAGILHFSNEGVASWYDFAHEIVHQANLPCKIVPISTHEYPLPAQRPAFSLMAKKKIKDLLKIEIPHWKQGLTDCLIALKQNQNTNNPSNTAP